MLLILWLYLTLILSELLSFFKQFTVIHFKITSFAVLLLLIIFAVRMHKKFQVNYRNISIPIICFVGFMTFLSGLLISPNNWDSLTYHLPRYLHWFENRNLSFFYTSNNRQNFSPILPDLLYAQFYTIFSSDKFIFLPIWICVIGTSFYIYKITFLVTSDKRVSYLAILIATLIPSQIAFSSSTQTDPISTFLVVLLLYYVILLREDNFNLPLGLIILMIPLFLTTKTTGLILSIPIYFFALIKCQKYIKRYLVKYIFITSLSILPAMPYIFRVWIFGVEAISSVFVSDISLAGVIVNSLRIFVNNFQTPIPGLNRCIEKIFYWGLEILKLDPNPKGYSIYGDFYLSNSLHGDSVGNPLHMFLLLASAIGFWISGRYRLLVILAISQFLLLGFIIGWQPWVNRFTSTILVVGSVLIGIWIAERHRYLQVIIVLTLMAYSSFWVFFNPSRSLIDPKNLVSIAKQLGVESSYLVKIRHDIVLPREKQYFSVKPELENSYISALKNVKALGDNRLYIKIGGDDFEYPIWALTNFRVAVINFKDENLYDIKNGNAYLFCTVDCDKYKLKQVFRDKNVTLWR